MTSARNHLPLLSGNRWLFFAGIALLAAACSPKVRPVTTAASSKKEQPAVTKKEQEKPEAKLVAAKTASIAMLLPLELDNLNPGGAYNSTTLSHANLSLDFYQGFKLALDTLAERGYNFKLQLFDTKDQVPEAQSLGYNAAIRSSNLVVGPIFPDDMHAFADILSGPPKLIVSPLSPASPSNIKNPNLVTVATPLVYHAKGAADYINEHYRPKKVFILKSGFSDENNYIIPFKKQIDSIGKGKIKVVAEVIQRGQLNGLMPQLSATEENIFVVPSTNQGFLMVTLHSLDSLSKNYKVVVFGHPNWRKFAYLKTDLLSDLKTHITSTSRVDWKDAAIAAFARDYRRAYRTEPNYYAIMGYDEGMYFGGLLTGGTDIKTLDKADFTGILNKYHFIKRPGVGWINTHVNVLQYDNFELKKAE
ncbi:ABC transporter substrate-binding protein [Mucilaginibacter ginsenosidivorans]|uniref:Amino acid ABC transporter substrate-binding protein n=1 Tax=Mucilaginibacter ginsenosidivorans TaxID=398053 RepID=A0A5B8UW51_9SPHI|nr:ABC transporter substrate-binding protein [Mucilaginibacter ginsenosidivorans]QEC63132.1 amino acid ABC transporter substrate-binding protein [Mucilaginibacter ginsenosidivorans]